MSTINRSAILPYSAQQMYELVNDVNHYPAFLPGCVASHIISSSENEMTVSLDVAKMGVRKTFITRNILEKNKRISMHLVQGPFRRLTGGWMFYAISPSNCRVEFALEFEFNHGVFEFIFARIFEELAGNMVDAFTKRAREVYGE